jgi:hypothetical protein
MDEEKIDVEKADTFEALEDELKARKSLPKSLIREMIILPALLKEKSSELNALNIKVKEVKSKLDSIESQILRQIFNETEGVEGKKRFTNKEQRDAELTLRQFGDKDYKENLEQLDALNFKISTTKIDYEYASDCFSRNKYLIKLLALEKEQKD